MSDKNKKAALIYALTHLVDWLINGSGKKHNLPQWQVELMKVGATLLISSVV